MDARVRPRLSPAFVESQSDGERESDGVRSPQERQCRVCHTPDHSDRFDFDTYRRTLIAPGHGAPAAHVAATGG